MIELKTDCKDCIHNKVCKYKDNAKHYMEELKDMKYNDRHNYNWDTIMSCSNVNITFSCSNFQGSQSIMYR